MKFAFMIYVTEFLNDCCVTWMQIYQFCCSMHVCPPPSYTHTLTHTHISLYASHQKFSWRCFQWITNFVHFSLSTSLYSAMLNWHSQ